jgi:serine/threonine-protein kinase
MQVDQVLGGRYRLEERLGEGGMSVVWRAFDVVLNRPVAVKVPSGLRAADLAVREVIRAEAQAAARLSHPHLANVYDYGEMVNEAGGTTAYVVMELLEGPSLAQRLSDNGPLAARVALRVCAQVAGALAFAHAHGLVHRDIKPGNVMLTATGAKVVDFGVAAATGSPDLADAGGRILGTPNYVAPERLRGGPVVPASDVYSLGLVFYRLLTGRLPWASRELADVVAPPEIDDVPTEIGDLFRAMVDRDPDRRPTAREAAVAFAAAAGIRPPLGDDPAEATNAGAEALIPISAVPLSGPPPSDELTEGVPSPRPRRRRLAPALAAVLAAMVAAMAVALSLRGGTLPIPGANAAPPAPSATAAGTHNPGSTVAPDPSGATTTNPDGPPGPNGPDPRVVNVGPSATATMPGGGFTSSGATSTTTTRPAPPTRTRTRTPAPPSSPVTFVDVAGNSVTAVCRNTLAEVTSASAGPGFTVLPGSRGPASAVRVAFQDSTIRRVIGVRCAGGVPVAEFHTRPL